MLLAPRSICRLAQCSVLAFECFFGVVLLVPAITPVGGAIALVAVRQLRHGGLIISARMFSSTVSLTRRATVLSLVPMLRRT